MEKELLVGDIHDQMSVYDDLEAILAKEKSIGRAFFAGDFSHKIDHAALNKYLAIAKQEMEGKSDEEKEKIAESAFATEAMQRYLPHEKRHAALAKKGLKLYGVLGNHDNVFAYEFLKTMNLLETKQHLLEEGILGSLHTTELRPEFAGPENAFAVPIDDHPDVEKSPVYQTFKDKKLSLILAHKEAAYPGDKHNSGNGLKALVDKNGCDQYCGHIHGGYIRLEANDTWVFNPGVNHYFVIERENGKFKAVTIYKTSQKNKNAGEYRMAA